MKYEDVAAIVRTEVEHAHYLQSGTKPILTGATRPIGDLPNFDSPLAEDVTAVILLKLGLEVKAIKCPFTKRTHGEYATLDGIVRDFFQAYSRLVPVNA